MSRRYPLAGLWERWRVREGVALTGELAALRLGDVLDSFTVLSTQAHEPLAPIHHRMPVIVAAQDVDGWLTGAEVTLGPAAGLSARRASLLGARQLVGGV